MVNDKKVRSIIRFHYMWSGVSNYVRPDEMKYVHRAERADQYLALETLRAFVEGLVHRIVEPKEPDITRIRQYKNAVMQLMSLKYKRHRWGYKMFEAMTDEELRDWWVSYWEKQGLNSSILRELWDNLWLVLKRLGQHKYYLGRLVQIRRKYKAMWS